MPSPTAWKIIAAGFVMSVLIWSLIPRVARDLQTADWVAVPEDFSPDRALAILEAQAEIAEGGWTSATGHATPEIGALVGASAPEE